MRERTRTGAQASMIKDSRASRRLVASGGYERSLRRLLAPASATWAPGEPQALCPRQRPPGRPEFFQLPPKTRELRRGDCDRIVAREPGQSSQAYHLLSGAFWNIELKFQSVSLWGCQADARRRSLRPFGLAEPPLAGLGSPMEGAW